MDQRVIGIVKDFDIFKGFGFIQRQQGKDVFFFYNEINSSNKILNLGDRVSFILQKTPKGYRAFDITKEGE